MKSESIFYTPCKSMGTVVYMACNGVFEGAVVISDTIKDGAKEAIHDMKQVGVRHTVMLTGDRKEAAETVAQTLGIDEVHAELLPGGKVEQVEALLKAEKEKERLAFVGDGINDAAAMKAADIGISVDTAVDVAKESADIILLEKDLMVLEEGIIEGRKTYANMIKYIKMTASSNFGNMFSVLAASALLPFLPMMSVHLIFLNLIYDLSCTAIPWDNVDEEFIAKPRKWDASSVGSFMIWIGPTSSIFDLSLIHI